MLFWTFLLSNKIRPPGDSRFFNALSLGTNVLRMQPVTRVRSMQKHCFQHTQKIKKSSLHQKRIRIRITNEAKFLSIQILILYGKIFSLIPQWGGSRRWGQNFCFYEKKIQAKIASNHEILKKMMIDDDWKIIDRMSTVQKDEPKKLLPLIQSPRKHRLANTTEKGRKCLLGIIRKKNAYIQAKRW